MIDHDDVRRIALGLPGVEERASYGGRPSWRTPQRMFTWIRDAPEALVVWVAGLEDKEGLLSEDPDVFFTTAHYDGQPIVLVRLDTVTPDEARELITESWRLRASKRDVAAFDAGTA
ncbi:MAG: MmcQ/YjbR family DNA-binding protein [Desertimonas sp.]